MTVLHRQFSHLLTACNMDCRVTRRKVGDVGIKFILQRRLHPFTGETMMLAFMSALVILTIVGPIESFFVFVPLIPYYCCCIWEECITVLPTFGIEFSSRWYCGYAYSEFVVWDEIDTIIINEGFRMFEVHYYLAILPHHQRKLYLPLKQFTPRLDILLPIYKEIKQMIKKYNETK